MNLATQKLTDHFDNVVSKWTKSLLGVSVRENERKIKEISVEFAMKGNRGI